MCNLLSIILWKNWSSMSVNRVPMSSASWSRYPSFMDLRRKAFSRTQSAAEQKLDHAGAAYISLASTVVRNMSCKDRWGRPRALNTRSAYSTLEDDASSSVTWSLEINLSLMMTSSSQLCHSFYVETRWWQQHWLPTQTSRPKSNFVGHGHIQS